MKDINLPVCIAVDVCLHEGNIIVARHTGDQVIVEGYDLDLFELGEATRIEGIAGNAAPRIHSWAGVLWLAYRDTFDRGFLIRLDSGEAIQLTPMFNAMSPFAFGRDCVAWMGDPRIAFTIGLGEPVHHNNVHTFSDSMATGLSHVQDGKPVTYDEMRTLRPYAVGFHQSGEFLIGEDFANRGLRGEVIGQPGRFVLWTDANMQGPRLAQFNGQAALIAWASGNHSARLGIISPADLKLEPEPPPIPDPPKPPPEPPMPDIPDALNDQRALVAQIRRELYPELEGPPLKPMNNAAKAFQITKHVAWRLRQHGIGLVKAKPGSDNNVEGYTNDIVALKSGAHWDVLIGGDGDAFPSWSLVEEQHWPAIKPRWAEPIDMGGPEPPPDEPEDPDDPDPPPSGNQLDRIESKLDRLLSVYRV